MRLLPSQKNSLYDIINSCGLSPAQFEFVYSDSNEDASKITTVLTFKNSEYFFSFASIESLNYVSFSPAQETYRGNSRTSTWDDQLYHFESWIENLIREINSPDKWDRLDKEIQGIKINFENSEDKFSIQEYEELKSKVILLKEGINNIGLLSDQTLAINSKLDCLTELAKDMNKFDWKSLFIGTIISIIIQLSVTQENSKSLWNLIKLVFNNYLLP